jgi:hypothetical protein
VVCGAEVTRTRAKKLTDRHSSRTHRLSTQSSTWCTRPRRSRRPSSVSSCKSGSKKVRIWNGKRPCAGNIDWRLQAGDVCFVTVTDDRSRGGAPARYPGVVSLLLLVLLLLRVLQLLQLPVRDAGGWRGGPLLVCALQCVFSSYILNPSTLCFDATRSPSRTCSTHRTHTSDRRQAPVPQRVRGTPRCLKMLLGAAVQARKCLESV